MTGRHYQVALFLPSLNAVFLTDLIRQFERLARASHYNLIVLTYGEDMNFNAVPSMDGSIVYVMPQQLPPHAGQRPQVLLCPKVYGDSSDLPAVNPRKLGMGLTPDTAIPDVASSSIATSDVVQLDMDSASLELVQHIIQQGCKRIAIVAPRPLLQPVLPRYGAYLEAMQQAGLAPEVIQVSIPLDARFREAVDEQLSHYFERNGYPDAVICSNDELAIGAYRSLKRNGRRIPSETAVTGCDNIEEGEDAYPTLTTIDLNTEIACQNAWDLLLTRLDNPQAAARTVTVQAQTVFRDSSKIAR